MSLKEVAEALVAERDAKKKPREHSMKTQVAGKWFASKWEAHRYLELKAMQEKGIIRSLELQRPFALVVNEIHVCDYVADFVYLRLEDLGAGASWQRVVEDAKGHKTEMYRLKKKLVRACLGIRILETRAASRQGRT